MNDEYIWSLIAKFCDGSIKEKEEGVLLAWIGADSENRKIFKEVVQLMETKKSTPQVDTKQAWQKVKGKLIEEELIRNSAEKNFRFSNPYGLAAVFLLLAMLAGASFFIPWQGEGSQKVISISHPGDVDSFLVRLPDGSRVWLNKTAQLTYEKSFGQDERMVELLGEGFFEVVKDSKRPFVVVSQGVRTMALGTSFNVQAFADQDEVIISLATGKVRVSTPLKSQPVVLAPGEEIKVSPRDGSHQKRVFEPEERLAWKEGMIYFKSADVQQVVKTLSRWYGISFEIKDREKMKSQLSATYKQESLEDILDMISFSADYEFTINGSTVTVHPSISGL